MLAPSQSQRDSQTPEPSEPVPYTTLASFDHLSVNPEHLNSLGSPHLSYHRGWQIITCDLCRDGLPPSQRAIKDHLRAEHNVQEWNGSLKGLTLVDNTSAISFRGHAHQLPPPIVGLPLYDVETCSDCSYTSLYKPSTKLSKLATHCRRTGHRVLHIKCKGQTVQGNRQYVQTKAMRGKNSGLFPVRAPTTPATAGVALAVPPAATTPATPSASLTQRFAMLASQITDTSRLEIGERDIRPAVKRLAWYEMVKGRSEAQIAALVRTPKDNDPQAVFEIDRRLEHIKPFLRLYFDAAFASLSTRNSYIKASLYGAIGKQLNVVNRSTDYFRELYRFVAFALRIHANPIRLAQDFHWSKRAEELLKLVTDRLLDSDPASLTSPSESHPLVAAVGELSYELFFGVALGGVANPSRWAIGYFLPFNLFNRGSFDKPENMRPKLKHLDWCARLICVHRHNAQIDAVAASEAEEEDGRQEIADIIASATEALTTRPGPYTHLVYCVQVISDEAKGKLLLPNSDWADAEGTTFLYENNPIQLSNITSAAQQAIDHCWHILTTHLLCGMSYHRARDSKIIDNHGNTTPGYGFHREPENGFGDIDTVLFNHVDSDTGLKAQFGLAGATDGLVGNVDAIKEYIRQAEEFRRHLAVALHLCCGAPSRGTELLAAKFCNLPTSARDFFVSCGTIVHAPSSSKPSNITGRHSVRPKGLPPILAEVYVAYIVIVRPFEAVMWSIYRPSEDHNRLTVYLFSENNKAVDTPWLTRQLHRAFHTAGAPGWGVSEYRHAYIALGRRHLGLDDEAEEDNDDDEGDSRYFDLQAGHSSKTAAINYARDTSTPANLTSEDVLQYVRLSNRWGVLIDVYDYVPKAPQPMRMPDDSEASSVEVAKNKNPPGPITLTPAHGQPSLDFQSPFTATSSRFSKRKSLNDDSGSSPTKKPMTDQNVEPEQLIDLGAFTTPDQAVRFEQPVPFSRPVNTLLSFGQTRASDSLRGEQYRGPFNGNRPAAAAILPSVQGSTPTVGFGPAFPPRATLAPTLPELGSDTPGRGPLGSPLKLGQPVPFLVDWEETHDSDEETAQIPRVDDEEALRIKAELRFQLRIMTGDHNAAFREHQLEAAMMVLSAEQAAMLILPTGFGKTICYTVISKLPEHRGVTIVTFPSIALGNNLFKRFTQWRLKVAVWKKDLDPNTVDRGFVLVSADLAGTLGFMEWAAKHASKICRVIIEEAHLALQAAHWRPALAKIGMLRAKLDKKPFILVSGTVPPTNAPLLLDALYLDSAAYMRVPNIRPSHRLAVWPQRFKRLTESGADRDKSCAATVKKLVAHLLDQWCSPRGQILIFCTNKATVQILGNANDWPQYYRKQGKNETMQQSDVDMQAQIQEFIDNKVGRVAVCTPVLSVGVDLPFLEVVLHVGHPNDATDFLQEIGRCGRTAKSAEKALSIWIPVGTPIPSSVSFDNGLDALVNVKNGEENCRWWSLIEYNDGKVANCKSMGIERCDLCYASVNAAPPAYVPPGTAWHPQGRGDWIDRWTVGPIRMHTGIITAPIPVRLPGAALISPLPPPVDTTLGGMHLRDQALAALDMLRDRRASGETYFAACSRINRAKNDYNRLGSQGLGLPVHATLGRECSVCFLYGLLPGATTVGVNHPEKPGLCPRLPLDTFKKVKEFRDEVKSRVGRTGGHCRSCLFPYDPSPSLIHSDPSPTGGCTIAKRGTPQASSDTDCLHVALYALFYLLEDHRPSNSAFSMTAVADVLATEGHSGLLIVMELMLWLRGELRR